MSRLSYFTILSLIFLLPLISSCAHESQKLEARFKKNKAAFAQAADELLNQRNISSLTLETNDGVCGVVNSWRKCAPDSRWKKSMAQGQEIYLTTLDDVLSSEKIIKKDYERWSQFLKDNGLNTLTIWRAHPLQGTSLDSSSVTSPHFVEMFTRWGFGGESGFSPEFAVKRPALPARIAMEQDCVEFEIGVHGLRYEKGPKPLMKDTEYLEVKSLGEQWFLYTRDWN